MISDSLLGLVGLGATLVSLGVAVYAIKDNRRERTQREKAIIAAHDTVARSYGLMIGIKGTISLLSLPQSMMV